MTSYNIIEESYYMPSQRSKIMHGNNVYYIKKFYTGIMVSLYKGDLTYVDC